MLYQFVLLISFILQNICLNFQHRINEKVFPSEQSADRIQKKYRQKESNSKTMNGTEMHVRRGRGMVVWVVKKHIFACWIRNGNHIIECFVRINDDE